MLHVGTEQQIKNIKRAPLDHSEAHPVQLAVSHSGSPDASGSLAGSPSNLILVTHHLFS